MESSAFTGFATMIFSFFGFVQDPGDSGGTKSSAEPARMIGGGRYRAFSCAPDETGRIGDKGTRGAEASEDFLPSIGTLKSPGAYPYGDGEARQERKGGDGRP